MIEIIIIPINILPTITAIGAIVPVSIIAGAITGYNIGKTIKID